MKKMYGAVLFIGLCSGFYYITSRDYVANDKGREMILNQQAQIEVTSSAFADGALIPARYTCNGSDTLPPLSFGRIPAAAQSLAIICDDPDAPVGLWVHWVVFNLPATVHEIKEGDEVTQYGAIVGTNSWGKQTWGGPCPPSGTHRYYFKVYALDTKLTLDKQANNTALLNAMEGHVLASGQLMGRYAQPGKK